MRSLNPWAVIAGLVVDVMGSVLMGTAFGAAIGALQIASGGEPTPIAQIPYPLGLVLGLLFTTLGGLTAAEIVGRDRTRHGCAVGIASLVAGQILNAVLPGDALPTWYLVLGMIGVVPAGALGGVVSDRRAARARRPDPKPSPDRVTGSSTRSAGSIG